MTHEEWISQIVQAVHAANQGQPETLHHLASVLMAHETEGPAQALEDAAPMTGPVVHVSPYSLTAPDEADEEGR